MLAQHFWLFSESIVESTHGESMTVDGELQPVTRTMLEKSLAILSTKLPFVPKSKLARKEGDRKDDETGRICGI